MQQESMFDVMRGMGVQALRFSKDWFTDPILVGERYTRRQLLEGTNGRINLNDPNNYFQAHVQSFYCSGLLSGRWAMSGFPTVTLGHRTAAALMATTIKQQDVLDFVRAPWPGLAIRLPSDMLFIEEDGELRAANLMIATEVPSRFLLALEAISPKYSKNAKYNITSPTRWWYKLFADSPNEVKPSWITDSTDGFFRGISLWGFNTPLEFLGTLNGGADEEGYEEWNTHQPIPLDRRSDRLARMLLIGTCLYLAGEPQSRAARNAEDGVQVVERLSKWHLVDPLPVYTEYQITSAIKSDLHHAVRDYVWHGNDAPSARRIVSGDWKRIQVGGQSRLRHINPFLKDIDAPKSTPEE